MWSCYQTTCWIFLLFITYLYFVTVRVKEIKYYYCSLSHRWCVHLSFVVFLLSFCCFGPGSLASVVDEPRLSSGPNCPSSRWSRWASKRWRAVPHWGTEGDRLSSPRPATGDRGPAKVSGGAHFLFACSYLTLVNCFSSGSVSLGEI